MRQADTYISIFWKHLRSVTIIEIRRLFFHAIILAIARRPTAPLSGAPFYLVHNSSHNFTERACQFIEKCCDAIIVCPSPFPSPIIPVLSIKTCIHDPRQPQHRPLSTTTLGLGPPTVCEGTSSHGSSRSQASGCGGQSTSCDCCRRPSVGRRDCNNRYVIDKQLRVCSTRCVPKNSFGQRAHRRTAR